MSTLQRDITADAVALQEKDSFREQGWVKVVSPAKVNLHLAIGERKPNGYHNATTIMHALNLHDTVYLRRRLPGDPTDSPNVYLVSCGDVEAPKLPSHDNIAHKAILELARLCGREDVGIEVRIEKNIPAQGGLGGGSSNAAATLVGTAHLWGIDPDDPAIEQAARNLGSDIAFFLHGGCSLYEGTGEIFVRSLTPSKQPIALVKPAGGVSTAEAYREFDRSPLPISEAVRENAQSARSACDVMLFNNLAPASEALMPELADVRRWLEQQDDVENCLLCGSGATTFAVCKDFAGACRVVSEARKRGLWARATSFGSLRALPITT